MSVGIQRVFQINFAKSEKFAQKNVSIKSKKCFRSSHNYKSKNELRSMEISHTQNR